MTDKTKLTGSCLCGKVKVKAEIKENKFDACHCGICRKWTGSIMLGVEAGQHATFEGEENISVYDSSEWAQRGFCKNCGTHLFYRLKENKYYFLPLGWLENTEKLNFHSQIFIDKKPANYSFVQKTENLTEAEFFAKHAA